ncbi:DEKNAAC100138 [Brettanomyces naardenensis]|uniref:DEKNAAC100138 n=1 Tax=Brettanomyces naardenensis TaxID=13370 RepID=A0A448YGA5_BRENA|nr:DEKNAAC100138 [Brettanomyces naardenensis]
MPCKELKRIRIVLLDLNKSICDAWLKSLEEFNRSPYSKSNLLWFDSPVEIYVHNGSFESLSEELEMKPKYPYVRSSDYHYQITSAYTTTTVLSPGNSVGYMGGGFDRVLANLFSHNDFTWKHAEMHVQSQLLDQYKGYLTPGNANLIEFHSDAFYRDSKAWNLLNANSILHLPTMRVPRPLVNLSTLELYRFVFDCTWELLSTVNKANIETLKWKEDKHAVIDTLLLTGIGTGYGGVPIEIVGKAMIAAIVIFTNHALLRVEKSIYCLKFVGEDYQKLIQADELAVKVNTHPFDPRTDGLDKLF